MHFWPSHLCHLLCEVFYDFSQVEPTVVAFWAPTVMTLLISVMAPVTIAITCVDVL